MFITCLIPALCTSTIRFKARLVRNKRDFMFIHWINSLQSVRQRFVGKELLQCYCFSTVSSLELHLNLGLDRLNPPDGSGQALKYLGMHCTHSLNHPTFIMPTYVASGKLLQASCEPSDS